MRNKALRRITTASVVALAVLAAPALYAQQGPDEGFSFSLEPAVFAGMYTDVDTNSSKFEEYRDMSSNFFIPWMHLSGESGDGNRLFDFYAENAGRADQRYTLNYGVSGGYDFVLDYNQIPHRFGYDARMIHELPVPNYAAIADPIQGLLQGQVEAAPSRDPDFIDDITSPFIDAATPFDLELSRKRTRLFFGGGELRGFGLGVDFRYEKRDGNRAYGTTFGFNNVVETPEPIDYDTMEIEVAGEYNADRGGMRFGYRYSGFKNEYSSLLYDNPYRLVDSTDGRAYLGPITTVNGPAMGRNALPPENDSNLIFADGRMRFGDSGWLRGAFSYNMMRQDDPLLPHTTNTAINPSNGAPINASDPSALPVSNADARVNATRFNIEAGTRFAGGKGNVKGFFKMYNYANDSAEIEFEGYVRMDAVWEEIGRITVPYAYTVYDFGGDVGYELARGSTVSFGYHRERWDRDFREITESDEDFIKLSYDGNMMNGFSLRADWEHGSRSTDEYLTEAQLYSFTHEEDINNQPGLRKYDEAERTFDRFRVFALYALPSGFDLSAGFDWREDDYDESEFGLLNDRIWSFNAEVGYNPTDKMGVFFYYNRADRESFQRARQSGGTLSTSPLDDWELTLTEKTDTIGAGFNAKFSKSWGAMAMFNWNKADGDTLFFTPPGGRPDSLESFPEYDDNEYLQFYARLSYYLSKHVSASFWYGYEDWQDQPFARAGLDNILPGSLLLNGNDGDYEAHIVAGTLSVKIP